MKLRNKKGMSLLVCVLLMLSLTVNITACGEKNENQAQAQSSETLQTEAGTKENQVEIIGEGSVKFLFTVVDKDGNESNFEIHTEQRIVGDALLEAGLITGEESQYGLFVKTVNGITADYDTDSTYWAFYVNGEYASSGVDTTEIEEGTAYMFKVEK